MSASAKRPEVPACLSGGCVSRVLGKRVGLRNEGSRSNLIKYSVQPAILVAVFGVEINQHGMLLGLCALH